MKSFTPNFLLLVLTMLLFSACGRDCEAPELSENIISTWELQLAGGEVEFQTDGTLIDPDDSLFGAEVNGTVFSDKTYTLDETTLTVTASAPGGGGSSSADFEVTQNECDEIKIDVLGFTETMKRK